MTIPYTVVTWVVITRLFKQISNYSIPIKVLLPFLLFIAFLQGLQPTLLAYCSPFLLFILCVGIFRPRWTKLQLIFYSFLPFFVIDILQRQTLSADNLDFSLMEFTLEMLPILALYTFSPVLIYGLALLFIKIMKIDFSTVEKLFFVKISQRTIYGQNAILLLYAFLIQPILLWKGSQLYPIEIKTDTAVFSIELVDTVFFFFIILLIYLNFKAKDYYEAELLSSKEQQITAMTQYNQHIESLYKEIRSFRHDYTNLLVTLSESIKSKDMNTIEEIYQSVLANTDKTFYEGKYHIAQLANVGNAALKALLSAKLIEANQKQINLSVEIPEVIDIPNIEVIDFITIISIFLDNAIEAAIDSDSKTLDFVYLEEENKQILLIQNSTKEKKMNTRSIYQYGHSSKGDNRGIGLANVKDILSRYSNMSLKTSSSDYVFSQELQIYKDGS